MLAKDSFPFIHIFFILPNTGKYEKLSLYKVFYQNKQSRNFLSRHPLLQLNPPYLIFIFLIIIYF